ncbi:hypothetical protein TNCV_134171 [Trichonephila clavipes]|nr:hypothetical protein TNCV_134171 [Trichonephila clavipes]
MSGKKKLSLQETLDPLQILPSESSDALTDDSSDEKVPANNFLKFSLEIEAKKTQRAVLHVQKMQYFQP